MRVIIAAGRFKFVKQRPDDSFETVIL